MEQIRKVFKVIFLASTTQPETRIDWMVNGCAVKPWNHPFKSGCNVTFVCATFPSYLGSPLTFLDGGLYLHSPASEGMWMEAYQSTSGSVPVSPVRITQSPFL